MIEGESFTARGVIVGLLVGTVICFSNMYFGLQTGWVSTMTMPASLMGFGLFKTLSRHLKFPFSPVENVLVQTVAGSMAIMPLGCGFVGVVSCCLPLNVLRSSLTYRYAASGNELLAQARRAGTYQPSLVEARSVVFRPLLFWCCICCSSVRTKPVVIQRLPVFHLISFHSPVYYRRRQVIIREQLKFPSGFSTAVLISVLHGKTRKSTSDPKDGQIAAGFASLVPSDNDAATAGGSDSIEGGHEASDHASDWRKNVQLLLLCFFVSGIFTFATYFFPILRNLPIFGTVAASTWLWTLNPSLAYVGQGIIMGPATTLHMLLGAAVGWGILSPLAKYKGWAPGPVDDWEHGSKGWIVWVSLAIMLADAVVSLGYLASRSALRYLPDSNKELVVGLKSLPRRLGSLLGRRNTTGYTSVSANDTDNLPSGSQPAETQVLTSTSLISDDDDESTLEKDEDEDDAPPSQQISDRTVAIGLVLSIVFCVVCTDIVFGNLVPLYATITAVFMALVLSIMGVRALGETDLNPVSGISKLAQLFFALIIPQGHKSSVLINLVAGAVSEAGALQAGDLMQDLKTGHLLGAAPSAQFWGQVIGATVGAVASAFIYRLYTAVYQVPGELFQVPTGYVWIFTARLVTGEGLPSMAREWAMGSAVLFAITTGVRIYLGGDKRLQALVPGGIAVAVGKCCSHLLSYLPR